MSARISRVHLSDESLDRGIQVLLAQVLALGALIHRHRDNEDLASEFKLDDEALADLLGILLGEQRGRRRDDRDLPA